MKASLAVAMGVGVVALPWSAAYAGPASLQGLGDLPGGAFLSIAYDVSADGCVVVGASAIGSSAGVHRFEAFRWQDGVMSGLGDLPGGIFDSEAYAVSADGSVVVGSGNGYQAFRWEDGVMSALGGFQAIGVSADGSVVVGNPGFRWEDGVMTDLGDLPGGASGTTAYEVTADGSVVVGYSSSANGYEAFRWENGTMSALGYLPGGDSPSGAFSVSPDGLVIVGSSQSQHSGPLWEAFRWESGVMTALGGFPREYFIVSEAFDVSADGSVVVGESEYDGAFIWTDPTGMLDPEDVLTALGVDLTGWSLGDAMGISDDGLTIVGTGQSPSGIEGWIATLPADWIDQVTHELTVSIAKSDWAGWGTVDVEPNLAKYFVGKAVTLTAEPNGAKAFKWWKLYDPNHPNDPNYITTDANNPLTLIMTADREVVAVFKCAPGGGMLPMLLVMLGTLALFVRLRRKA